MKKLLFLALMSVGIAATAQTPCTPNTAITEPGIYPPPGSYAQGEDVFLPLANQNAYYEQTIQIVVPTDTLIDTLGTQISASVDSFVVIAINNLPPGMDYICDNSNCSWNGGANGCITIYGTSTVQGDFNIEVVIDGYVKVFGVPVNQVGTLGDYWIPVDYPVGVEESTSDFTIYPNPSNGVFNIELTREDVADVRIFDVAGREVYQGQVDGSATIDLDGLRPGIYSVSVMQNNELSIKRMIVE